MREDPEDPLTDRNIKNNDSSTPIVMKVSYESEDLGYKASRPKCSIFSIEPNHVKQFTHCIK
jgi:hypothetical protein